MISINIPGKTIFLGSSPKTDPQGAPVLKAGKPVARVQLVALPMGDSLTVTMPMEQVLDVSPLTPVSIKGLRVGAFKEKLYFTAESMGLLNDAEVSSRRPAR